MRKIIAVLGIVIVITCISLFKKEHSTAKQQTRIVKINLPSSIGLMINKDLPKITKVSVSKENTLSEKFGTPVTNSLGIPDIWLDLIAKDIPENNFKARKAALLMFYYKARMYDFNTQEDLLKSTYREAAAYNCTAHYLTNQTQNDKFFDDSTDFTPSPQLKKISHKIDNNLSGHIIHGNYGENIPYGMEPCKYFIDNAGLEI